MDEDTLVVGSTDTVGGWMLDIDDEGRITEATEAAGRTYRLGQEVVSNGRFAAPKGTVGTLVEIQRPWSDGRTSDFLVVLFGGDVVVAHMKPKDLED